MRGSGVLREPPDSPLPPPAESEGCLSWLRGKGIELKERRALGDVGSSAARERRAAAAARERACSCNVRVESAPDRAGASSLFPITALAAGRRPAWSLESQR